MEANPVPSRSVDFDFKIGQYHWMSIPNLLTFLRISLIPIIVLVFYLPFDWRYMACAIIFALACVTDVLDGYLARKLEQVSPLGEFLDPVADKLVVAVALVLLVQTYATVWLTLPAAIIVGREIVISALREWMAELGKRKRVKVSGIGKFKTTAQMLAIILLLSQNPSASTWIKHLGFVLIYVASVLTLWSMIVYLQAAREDLMS
jgi:CDP-diacylglycerol--glycerol-3-phosphate 3-phosphatidyltransferase